MTKKNRKKKQIGPGHYFTQVNAVKKILKLADLYRDQNQYSSYLNFKLSNFKSMKFIEAYKKVLNEIFLIKSLMMRKNLFYIDLK